MRLKLGCLESIDFLPMRASSALLQLIFRNDEVNEDLIFSKQALRAGGGKVEENLEER